MSACPTEEQLAALATGTMDPASRGLVIVHVKTCPTCSAKVVPIFLDATATGTTHFDSPRAMGRRVTRDPADDDEVVTQEGKAAEPSGLEDTRVSDESTDPTKPPPISVGNTVGRYVVLSRLGAGGMGEVYAAWDPVLGRRVAVKILRADFQDAPVAEELRARLLREAQALARLSHPAVVAVHDVGLLGSQVYIAMEFVEGLTVTQWLAKTPRPWSRTLDVFLAAGEGLAAAHDSGLTHRDFKPDNVLVGADNRVVVMDFGLAHAWAEKRDESRPRPLEDSSGAMRRAITQPGVMLGTPAYMSPEALFGKATDFRSDIFSFCASLFEAFYGYRPYEGASAAAIASEIQLGRIRPPPRRSPVPRRIHQLLEKGLKLNPDDRFRTMRALLIQLGRRRSARVNLARSVGVGVVVCTAIAVAAVASHRAQRRCAGFEARLTGVWDDGMKRRTRQAFLAVNKPWAAPAATQVEKALDAYAARWVNLRKEACEAAASPTDEALGQNIVCLSRRLSDLEAVSQLFVQADGEVVERAVATAASLPSLDTCASAPGKPSARGRDRPDLRAELSAAKARLDAARFAEAHERAQALTAAAHKLGERNVEAEAMLLDAMARARGGDPKAADTLVESSILLAEVTQDDELAARGWIERLGFTQQTSSGDEADRWARHATAAVERAGAPLELQASLANNEGVLALSRSRADEAVAAFTRAVELRRRLFGLQSTPVARSTSNLGTALRSAGRVEESIKAFRDALAIEEAVLDPTHPAVAETLNNLGNALRDKGDLQGARAAVERALSIKERAHGPDSLQVAVTLTNYGVLLHEAHDDPAAQLALERAVKIKEATTGADSLSTALSLTNLALVLRGREAWAEALKADERALGIRRVRLDAHHKDLAWNLTGMGYSLTRLGQLPQARKALEEAFSLRAQAGVDRGETAALLGKTLSLSHAEPARVRELLEVAVANLPPTHKLSVQSAALLEELKKGR